MAAAVVQIAVATSILGPVQAAASGSDHEDRTRLVLDQPGY